MMAAVVIPWAAEQTTAAGTANMTEQAHKLLVAVLQLPEDERAELVVAVMDSFEPSPEEDAEFAEEIKRRIAEVESGAVKTIPWEEVRKRLWEKL